MFDIYIIINTKKEYNMRIIPLNNQDTKTKFGAAKIVSKTAEEAKEILEILNLKHMQKYGLYMNTFTIDEALDSPDIIRQTQASTIMRFLKLACGGLNEAEIVTLRNKGKNLRLSVGDFIPLLDIIPKRNDVLDGLYKALDNPTEVTLEIAEKGRNLGI